MGFLLKKIIIENFKSYTVNHEYRASFIYP